MEINTSDDTQTDSEGGVWCLPGPFCYVEVSELLKLQELPHKKIKVDRWYRGMSLKICTYFLLFPPPPTATVRCTSPSNTISSIPEGLPSLLLCVYSHYISHPFYFISPSFAPYSSFSYSLHCSFCNLTFLGFAFFQHDHNFAVGGISEILKCLSLLIYLYFLVCSSSPTSSSFNRPYIFLTIFLQNVLSLLFNVFLTTALFRYALYNVPRYMKCCV